MSTWDEFGACSVDCGGGTQVRERIVLVEDAHGGEACGALKEEQDCNIQSCPTMHPTVSPVAGPVDGSSWSLFDCSTYEFYTNLCQNSEKDAKGRFNKSRCKQRGCNYIAADNLCEPFKQGEKIKCS